MSRPRAPHPAKLVISLLTADRDLVGPVAAKLRSNFGPMDLIGPWWPFDYTRYYQKELGAPLFRRMLSFKTLIPHHS